jgi:hypothetical protein
MGSSMIVYCSVNITDAYHCYKLYIKLRLIFFYMRLTPYLESPVWILIVWENEMLQLRFTMRHFRRSDRSRQDRVWVGHIGFWSMLIIITTTYIIYFLRWGWGWVHSVRRPLTGLLYQSWMIDDDECGAISVVRIGRGNRSTRRKPALVYHFVNHKSHMAWRGIEPGPPQWEADD